MTFWQKTFGGLNFSYYIRHFFFGLLIFAFFFSVMVLDNKFATTGSQIRLTVLFVILQLLYPYARFVYESIVGYIFGENVFFVNAALMLFVKAFTMTMCWAFAIFIAPIGLGYLYFHYTKEEKNTSQE